VQGIVFSGIATLERMSFDDTGRGDDEVVVEMKASGFCRSDLHRYGGERAP
jgi:(R,R)-butanediol dehydrogenase / meso-butanediol dehydrogenase / diacetyl reductase